MTDKTQMVSIRRTTLLRWLRLARAPYADDVGSFDDQVTKMFDAGRRIENGLASVLGQEPQIRN